MPWLPLGSAGGGSGTTLELLHVRDEKASGTAGGGPTVGSWVTRDLNTVLTNEITGASLASNTITLPAGTYDIDGRAPAFRAGSHKTRLWNVTDGTIIIYGSNGQCDAGTTGAQSDSNLRGRFTLAGSKVIRVDHIVASRHATHGFGHPNGNGAEIYTDVMIRKLS